MSFLISLQIHAFFRVWTENGVFDINSLADVTRVAPGLTVARTAVGFNFAFFVIARTAEVTFFFL